MKNTISKADWLAAGQCQAMAWYGLRVETPPPDEATRFRMEQGQEVGALARRLYPDGVRVARTAQMSAAGMTQALIADGSHQTLFEAAFESGPFVAKADILSREGGGWHLLEVKSSFSDSTSIKDYINDLAYTAMVLRRAGLAVVKTSLVLLSRDYRYGLGVDRLFTILDKTQDVDPCAAVFEEAADAVAHALLGGACPAPVLVSACRRCDFFATACLGAGHSHTVVELPNLHHTKLRKLSAEGIIGLSDVGADAAPPNLEHANHRNALETATTERLSGYRWMTVALFGESIGAQFERGVGQYPVASPYNQAPYKNNRKRNIERQLDFMRSRLRDGRFTFLFSPGGGYDPDPDGRTTHDLDDLVHDWVGHDRTVTIFDVSGLPPEILSTIVGTMLRIVYDMLFWAQELAVGGRQQPLLVVIDEAHRFLPVRPDGGGGDTPAHRTLSTRRRLSDSTQSLRFSMSRWSTAPRRR